MPRRLTAALLAIAGVAVASAPAAEAKSSADARFATFNASLNRGTEGLLVSDLSDPNADLNRVHQARNVAEVIQRVAPDVVLINEFDFDEDGQAAELFRQTSSRSRRTARRRQTTRTTSSRRPTPAYRPAST